MLAQTGQDLFSAYCAGDAAQLYGGHFGSGEDRKRAVQHALRPLARDVADVLQLQQAHFAPSPARDQHLAALRTGAAAVVTGQQVGLFLGPLYTIYKAASAIRTARALSEETGQPVVPVFWLQSEDHDLAEIASCHVRTAGAPLSVKLTVSPDNRISVAHCHLQEDIENCFRAVQRELGNLPYAEEHLSRLVQHYWAGAGWVDAFAACLAELFAPEGLLLLNPRDPGLARACAAVHRRALLEAQPISHALLERKRTIESHGWRPSIHVREGAPLSFFHPEGATGPRFRLTPVGDGFAEVGGERVHGVEALLERLDSDPLCFSTSALLRPILQDTLLPTAAYVGGPGEVAYFAQMAPLYASYGMAMPLIVPRASLRIIEPRTDRLLVRTGLEPSDLSRSAAELVTRVLDGRSEHVTGDMFERHLVDGLGNALRRSLAWARFDDDADATAADGMLGELARIAAKVRQRYEKALRNRNGALVQELEHAKSHLYPDSEPQERFYGISYFAARYGERAFIDKVLQALVAFDVDTKDLRP